MSEESKPSESGLSRVMDEIIREFRSILVTQASVIARRSLSPKVLPKHFHKAWQNLKRQMLADPAAANAQMREQAKFWGGLLLGSALPGLISVIGKISSQESAFSPVELGIYLLIFAIGIISTYIGFR